MPAIKENILYMLCINIYQKGFKCLFYKLVLVCLKNNNKETRNKTKQNKNENENIYTVKYDMPQSVLIWIRDRLLNK